MPKMFPSIVMRCNFPFLKLVSSSCAQHEVKSNLQALSQGAYAPGNFVSNRESLGCFTGNRKEDMMSRKSLERVSQNCLWHPFTMVISGSIHVITKRSSNNYGY